MAENPTFEQARKEQQSIRRKSSRKQSRRKSSRKQSRRKSRKSSRRQSRRKSRRLSRRSSKMKKGSKDPKNFLWDMKELNIADLLLVLQGAAVGEAPVDLEPSVMIKATTLPPLQWLNTDEMPYAVKIANTGYTVAVTGLWKTELRPKLAGGPLPEEYELSQFHFHWGQSGLGGSEHLISHLRYPLEVHVVFRRSSYGIHERARREDDGLIVVVYLYSSSSRINSQLEPLISQVAEISAPSSERCVEPFTYSALFPIFTEDYILYNGWIKNNCQHSTLWFICRQTLAINEGQLDSLRQILGFPSEPIVKNYRPVKETGETKIFIVKPSVVDADLVLHPRPPTPQEYGERGKSSKGKSVTSKTRRQSRRKSRRSTARRQSKRQSKVSTRKSMQRKSKVGRK